MSIALLALAAAASHSVAISHHGTPMQATYTASAKVETKTVGARTPNRMDMQRCRWTATIVVDRKLDHSPVLARTLASDARMSGSDHGACPRGDALERRIADRTGDKLQAAAIAAAKRDHPMLMAELDEVKALASN